MQIHTNGQDDELGQILAIITKLARMSAGGDFIYRGEPERFPKVSSSLYRQYEEIEAEDFNIETAQSEIIKEARKYTSESDEFEILTQLQHYGGKTNLIDFTFDYLVALFFSCDGSPDEDGRVILLRKSEAMNPYIKEPRNDNNRVVAQKSIFVQPPGGYIQPDVEVVVPKQTKGAVLAHLRDAHGISTTTIYKDIFGFIKHQNLHQSAYTEFYKGLTAQSKEGFEEAIVHYSESIRLNPQRYSPYINRGVAYVRKGNFDLATRDFNRGIELEPKSAGAYVNRGVTYKNKGEIESAIRDYDTALELEPNNASAYGNRGNAYIIKGLPVHAMRDLNKAIGLEPEKASYYVNRGAAYSKEGAHRLAIEDYDWALELDPKDAMSQYNRGEAWLCLAKWEKAKPDLISARDTGMDIVSSFRNEFESVSHFEQRFGLKIPEDIAEMLGG